MFAVLATYATLTSLLALQLGATVLSDVYQGDFARAQIVALEEAMVAAMATLDAPAQLQDYLERRFGEFQRTSIAVYDPAGRRLAQTVGTPGPAPELLGAAERGRLREGGDESTVDGLGFVVMGAVRIGEGVTAIERPLGYVRVASWPRTTRTRDLVFEASWRWGFPIFLLSVAAAFLGAGSITRRLREAEAAVARVAEGDMSARIPVGEMDELGRVAATFNRTADLLERTVRDLEATDATRRRLIADFAHELNTPLTNVLAYLETLVLAEEDGGMEAAARLEFLKVAHDEGKRLAHLARDLETLTKLEANALVMERAEVDLVQLAADLVHRLRPRAMAQGLELDVRIDAPGLVEGDRMRLEQVGMNLLENALRYTKRGAVVMRVRREGDRVAWSVEDTGVGIPRDVLPRVMERFFRVDPSRTRATGGTGLGLSIVGGIVERHGGSVHIDSAEGQGTVVTIWLPARSAAG
jgi:signal transduction histidine kinase